MTRRLKMRLGQQAKKMLNELIAQGVNYRTAYRRVKETFKQPEQPFKYEFSTGKWV